MSAPPVSKPDIIESVSTSELLERATDQHKKQAKRFCLYAIAFSFIPYIVVIVVYCSRLEWPPYVRWVLDGTIGATVIGLCMSSVLLYLKDRPLNIKNNDAQIIWGFVIALISVGLFLVQFLKPIKENDSAVWAYMLISMGLFALSIHYTYRSQLVDEVRASPPTTPSITDSAVVAKLGGSMREATKGK